MNGVSSCMDALGHTICDPCDVIITPTPVYGRVFTNFTNRSGAKIVPLHLSNEVSFYKSSHNEDFPKICLDYSKTS